MSKDLHSDAKIRTTKPADAAYKLGDGGGLSYLVTETGSKLWRLKLRLGGKEVLFSIGAYPAVGIVAIRLLEARVVWILGAHLYAGYGTRAVALPGPCFRVLPTSDWPLVRGTRYLVTHTASVSLA